MRTQYKSCPLCGGVGEKHIVAKVEKRGNLPTDLTWMECTSCGHSYTKHYWTAEGMKELFSVTHDDQRMGGELDAQRMIWGRVLDRALSLGLNGRLIDLGCGNGALVATATEFGIPATGIDARPKPVLLMQQMGYDAKLQDISEADLTDAGMVALADVLEHMVWPRETLQRIRKQVKPGTLLFVSCPAMGCLTWNALHNKRDNPYWIEIEHHHNFTRERLYRLLREESFEPLTYGISPRWKASMEIFARAV